MAEYRRDMTLHISILQLMHTQITPNGLSLIKAAVRPYLDPATIEDCKNGFDICCELEKTGNLCLGDYEVLKTILDNIGLVALRKNIEEKEIQITPASKKRAAVSVDKNRLVHNDILRHIDQQMTARDFPSFKYASGAYLNPATMDSCSSGFDICCELEKTALIEVGNYTVLKQMLDSVQLIAIRRDLETLEKNITKDNTRRMMGSDESDGGPRESAQANDQAEVSSSAAAQGDVRQGLPPHVMRGVSEIIQRKWRDLGRNLNVDASDMGDIGGIEPADQCYAMLSKWVKRNGWHATPSALIEGLRKSSCNVVAEAVTNWILDLPFDS